MKLVFFRDGKKGREGGGGKYTLDCGWEELYDLDV